MTLLRCLVLLGLAAGVCGCDIGAPGRASDIQNLNAIGDDISAVTMTQSDSAKVHDPNFRTTLPTTYSVDSTTP
jgi:hypothetical protein